MLVLEVMRFCTRCLGFNMASKKDNQKKVDANAPSKEEMEASKKIRDKENATLLWVFVVIGIVFGSILVSYFWVESSKTFESGSIDWNIEDYENLQIFHGRFSSFTNPDLYYNVFFRTDPRKNDVDVIGNLSEFKYGGIISLSEDADNCRGELSRVMLDLSAFLKQGVGVGPIESGTTSELVSNHTDRTFATCEIVKDRTVVIVNIGEPGVVKSETNPYCYTITAEDCGDSKAVEKFMSESVADFRAANPLKK